MTTVFIVTVELKNTIRKNRKHLLFTRSEFRETQCQKLFLFIKKDMNEGLK